MKIWQTIKDKKCKHEWKKLKTEQIVFWFFYSINYEYLHCPKCGSSTMDEMNITNFKEEIKKGRIR